MGNEGFGVSFHEQGFQMQQFDSSKGFNTVHGQAIPLAREQLMMNAEQYCSLMEDLFQYPEPFNTFASKSHDA